MNTTIIKKDFWTSDEFIELHLDTKIVYQYLLQSPDKGYLNVYKFNKHLAVLCTGVSAHSVEAALTQLGDMNYIEIYNGYVGLLKGHSTGIGGAYGATNRVRELGNMPVDVREHFKLDSEGVIEKPHKIEPKKVGPKPETIADIIAGQPEMLRLPLSELVADKIERKKAPSTRAVKGWIAKLEKMYPNQLDKRVESIQQTIEKGWAGVFEVKNNDRTSEGREFM